MNRVKIFFFNRISLCLLAASIIFLSAWGIEKYAQKPPDVQHYATMMEQELHQIEGEIECLFNNGSFLLNAVEGYVLTDTIKKYINKPYTFVIYNDKDSIVYWNNNQILPFQSDIRYSRLDTIEKYEISESVFLKIRRPYDFLIDGVFYYYNLEAYIPLYRHYSISNDYLSNYFALMPKEYSEFVEVSKEPTQCSIKDRLGRSIIYLKVKEHYPSKWFIVFSTFFYCLSIFLLLMAVHLAAARAAKKGYFVGAVLGFVGFFLFFRLFTIVYDFPSLIHEYDIFHLRLSDTVSFWFYSLGEFLIDMGLLFWFSMFFARELQFRNIIGYSSRQKLAFLLVGYSFLIGGFSWIQFAVRDMVMSSDISFEFDNLSQLDYFSFLALFGIGFLLLSYFFITHTFFYLTEKLDYNRKTRITYFAILLVVFWGINSYFEFLLIDKILISLCSAVFALVLRVFVRQPTLSLSWVSIWLMLFSAFATTMLENASADKGILLRKNFAKALADERDLETENTINTLIPQILDDDLLQISISNPLSPSPRRQAVDLLTYRYLDNYFFGRYDYSVHVYTDQGRPYRGERRAYEEIMSILQNSQKTTCSYLQFYSHPEGAYSYFAQIPISQNGSLVAIIFIEFTPKKNTKGSDIYVELLSRNKERLESIYSQFNYGLYKYESLVAANNPIFIAHLAYDLPRPEAGHYKMLTTDNVSGNNYLIYKNESENPTISMVHVPKTNTFGSLSIFAYIFCFGIFLLFLIQIINSLLGKIFNLKLLQFQFENSLREQIQRGITLVTLASFIAIAIITILYNRTEYEEYHQSHLSQKVKSTAQTAEWHIQSNQDSITETPDAASLADIHDIDVNIYNINGDLISSSEPAVFERHLISRKMNPVAFQRLRHEQQNSVSQLEVINDFQYLSAYVPLKNRQNKTIAYLNLPYDLTGSNDIGSQDLIRLLSALLNVYVIFLLIAGAAAFYLARSITNPLSVVGEKLNKIELGKKNEPIYWDNDDEIGELVERYNQMILELEESTKNLARSQRESAWREMAKQIAHEIKNPLTPMKLNIQLLERVVNTNPEKAQKMVQRVAKTLIEQIDGLAHIASEFSNFAKMPVANNEHLNFNELVTNAFDLFKEETNMQFFLEMTDKNCTIFADKTQMMRVLNNLLKNAVQAIPEDQPGIIKVKLAATSTTAILSVTDNGCGIPESQKDDIFVPNFTTKSSGTGIGLAMSKTIVEMAKGMIYFESEERKGTTFFVEIPIVN